MNNVDMSSLSRININNFTEKDRKDGRLAIVNDEEQKTQEVRWLTLQEIEKENSLNKQIYTDLPFIIKSLNDNYINIEKDNVANVIWLNKKIKDHNKKIEKYSCYYNFVNIFRKLFGKKEISKYENIKIPLSYAFDLVYDSKVKRNILQSDIEQKDKLLIALNIAKEIESFHNKNIAHGKINLKNICLLSDDDKVLYSEAYTNMEGISGYNCSESLNQKETNENYNEIADDIWSFGVLLAEIFGLPTPKDYMKHNRKPQLANQDFQAKMNLSKDADNIFSVTHIIYCLTQGGLNKRITITDAIQKLNTILQPRKYN